MRTACVVTVVCFCTAACVAATCPKCKRPVPEGQKFCGHCGTRVPSASRPKPRTVSYAGPQSEWDDQVVERAIDRAVKYLWSRQRSDGHWDSFKRSPTGMTGLAVYALLAAGARVDDKRMVKALNYMAKHETNRVYALGLRCNAWRLADLRARGKYAGHLRREGSKLVHSINRTSGGWHYETTDRKSVHNSTAQYGVLGAWALARATGEVPLGFWSRVRTYWNRGQHGDGGWGYAHTRSAWHGNEGRNMISCGSMSAAGLASLFVCYDALSAGLSLDCKDTRTPEDIRRGLDWFGKHFGRTLSGRTPACVHHSSMDAYYLYGVERVGLASGYKYFGTHDWFQMGASHLMKLQQKNGAIHKKAGGEDGTVGAISETAFSVLFLVRGRYPVVMNKLEFDGDWNNRPRDLANLTRWLEDRIELPVTWQIVSFASDPWKWHDSSIMYISASRAPKFTAAQLVKLRQYVLRGGTILSVTECNGQAFSTAMRAVYKELFPRYGLKLCPPGHDVYSQHVLARLSGKPMMFELSNGVRPLAIHVDEDLPRAWQTYALATRKHAFDGAANIICYVAGSRANFRPRGTIPWPAAGTFKPAASVTVTRVKHGGNYDPEPLSLHRFALMAGPETRIAVKVMPPTPLADLPRSGAKLAALTGTAAVNFSRAETDAVAAFVAGGGLLVVDAAGGSDDFARSADRMLEQAFARRPQSLSSTSPLLRQKGFELTRAVFRRRTVLRTNMTGHEFNLAGITVDDGRRLGVVFSRDDITGGLIGAEAFSVDGYSTATAYRIMRNAVLYAASRR